jgi:hypothetical protein
MKKWRKTTKSVTIASNRYKIWTGYLQNTSLKRHRYTNPFSFLLIFCRWNVINNWIIRYQTANSSQYSEDNNGVEKNHFFPDYVHISNACFIILKTKILKFTRQKLCSFRSVICSTHRKIFQTKFHVFMRCTFHTVYTFLHGSLFEKTGEVITHPLYGNLIISRLSNFRCLIELTKYEGVAKSFRIEFIMK